ncbi:imelysin family protein [Frigidibacter sp. MR17.24]|uniref:imelysin family protein n=1 Tax=Frigidibacter sp. MR17.24 TaxID=3127345 RepID=UPI003012EA8F
MTRRTALAAPLLAALAAALPALPARADALVDAVVDGVIQPRFDAFAAAAADLARTAEDVCDPQSDRLRLAWNAAVDAWIPAQTFRMGPLEEEGRGLAIAFWPDPKGATPGALRRVLAGDPSVYASAETYADVSVAARGLYAIEALLYDPDLAATGAGAGATCAVLRAQAGDLAATAAAVAADWRDRFGAVMKTAGAEGNTRFLSAHEARQALFTALVTQLGFDAETRLGRPLGSIERPRPARAESREAGRSLRNVTLSLAANEQLARALATERPELLWDYFAYAERVADRLGDPVFAGVEDPTGRMRVEELKTAIERVHDDANDELAPMLGVTSGFNALDGD